MLKAIEDCTKAIGKRCIDSQGLFTFRQPIASLLGTRFLPWMKKVSTCRKTLLKILHLHINHSIKNITFTSYSFHQKHYIYKLFISLKTLHSHTNHSIEIITSIIDNRLYISTSFSIRINIGFVLFQGAARLVDRLQTLVK